MSIRPLQQPNGATLKCVQRVRETHIFGLKRVEQPPPGHQRKSTMFRWWQRLQDRERLAEEDATLLIARFGTRASFIARPPLRLMSEKENF